MEWVPLAVTTSHYDELQPTAHSVRPSHTHIHAHAHANAYIRSTKHIHKDTHTHTKTYNTHEGYDADTSVITPHRCRRSAMTTAWNTSSSVTWPTPQSLMPASAARVNSVSNTSAMATVAWRGSRNDALPRKRLSSAASGNSVWPPNIQKHNSAQNKVKYSQHGHKHTHKTPYGHAQRIIRTQKHANVTVSIQERLSVQAQR